MIASFKLDKILNTYASLSRLVQPQSPYINISFNFKPIDANFQWKKTSLTSILYHPND